MSRTFTEQEIAAIIGRAVQRQRDAERDAGRDGGEGADERAPTPAGAERVGLTLDELEQVGRVAGVDPAHLRAAADEVFEADAPGTQGAFAERWVDAPLTDAGWEDAVAALRASPAPLDTSYSDGDAVAIERIGQSYEWTRTDGLLGMTTRVNVSPRGDRTRVRVWGDSPSTSSLDIALTFGVVGGVLAWVATLFFDWASVLGATAIGAAVAGVLGAAGFFVSKTQSPEVDQMESDRVRGIADAVADAGVAAATGGEVAPAASPVAASDDLEPAGTLDLDALGEATPAGPSGRRPQERA